MGLAVSRDRCLGTQQATFSDGDPRGASCSALPVVRLRVVRPPPLYLLDLVFQMLQRHKPCLPSCGSAQDIIVLESGTAFFCIYRQGDTQPKFSPEALCPLGTLQIFQRPCLYSPFRHLC